ncbi:Valine--tRNA ligase [Candidatus Cyrtobacter comes]|uniref:Valine--tRNA ligase n=1 Tax=Candidatus Cyrtobacter comes TaxID=675776 RepID=A0ABU5L7R9_9RICK|nr:Valine--tRNA ligase [Candidatus Cyrtobacter comes]
MNESYIYKQTEEKWQSYWASTKIYKWVEEVNRDDNFVIDTPPPTVSGSLHMGHIYSYTQGDFIARFYRMLGYSVFYPIGFDDNGLPTERLIEKIKGIRAHELLRNEFIKICQETIIEFEKEFECVFRSIGISFDWDNKYQTISEHTQKISQMSFLDLYKKGLLYRSYNPTFWDYVDGTAIAQAEIEEKERKGIIYEIGFDTELGEKISIATTRPELISACSAIFVHPDDSRFKRFIGKLAITPIFGDRVDIKADEDVDMEKGTGAVMCCTFGDIQDIKWWKRYNLKLNNHIDKHGRLQNAKQFSGMKINPAREEIVKELERSSFIASKKSVDQIVKCAERSGSILEIIPTNQWYIKTMEYSNQLLNKAAECSWHPEYMKIRLDNWINGLNQDWCISRQRYFGIPFPVWYSKRIGEEGKVIVAEFKDLPIDPMQKAPTGYTMEEVEPEKDVMDTWATSALTPQISSFGITNNLAINPERHKKLFPADLRIQAHEIIRTWAFASIVKAFHHQNTIPWKNVMISGWCLANDKTKMSKSKGNVITPQSLIQEKGADVIRYWASNSKLGSDIIYSEDAFKAGKKLINKLWNVAKFLNIHISNLNERPKIDRVNQTLDLWILHSLDQVLEFVTSSMKSFEYSSARSKIEYFFFTTYCDNYIELVKKRLYAKLGAQSDSAVYTMWFSFLNILKMFAPFIPHITEELYHSIYSNEGVSIHERGSWPKALLHNDAKIVLAAGEHSMGIIEMIRKFKSEHNMPLSAELSKLTISGLLDDSVVLDIKNASNAKEVVFNHSEKVSVKIE